MRPRISVLISARKNSKYLANFLLGYYNNTVIPDDVHVMLNAGDTWNNDLVEYFKYRPSYDIKFYREDLKLGRAGLHEYFNLMLPRAKGDWVIYFCEDHQIILRGWDDIVRQMIGGTLLVDNGEQLVPKHEFGRLDHRKPWCLTPKFDNVGGVNHILSRGYVEAIGGVLGRHGWIDSYINDLNLSAFGSWVAVGRDDGPVLRFDEEMFHDFSQDIPSPMSEAHMQSITGEAAANLPRYDTQIVKDLIQIDASKLREASK